MHGQYRCQWSRLTNLVLYKMDWYACAFRQIASINTHLYVCVSGINAYIQLHLTNYDSLSILIFEPRHAKWALNVDVT